MKPESLELLDKFTNLDYSILIMCKKLLSKLPDELKLNILGFLISKDEIVKPNAKQE